MYLLALWFCKNVCPRSINMLYVKLERHHIIVWCTRILRILKYSIIFFFFFFCPCHSLIITTVLAFAWALGHSCQFGSDHTRHALYSLQNVSVWAEAMTLTSALPCFKSAFIFACFSYRFRQTQGYVCVIKMVANVLVTMMDELATKWLQFGKRNLQPHAHA